MGIFQRCLKFINNHHDLTWKIDYIFLSICNIAFMKIKFIFSSESECSVTKIGDVSRIWWFLKWQIYHFYIRMIYLECFNLKRSVHLLFPILSQKCVNHIKTPWAITSFHLAIQQKILSKKTVNHRNLCRFPRYRNAKMVKIFTKTASSNVLAAMCQKAFTFEMNKKLFACKRDLLWFKNSNNMPSSQFHRPLICESWWNFI